MSPLYYISVIKNKILRFYTSRTSDFISEKVHSSKCHSFFVILSLICANLGHSIQGTVNESYFRVGIIHGAQLFIIFIVLW